LLLTIFFSEQQPDIYSDRYFASVINQMTLLPVTPASKSTVLLVCINKYKNYSPEKEKKRRNNGKITKKVFVS